MKNILALSLLTLCFRAEAESYGPKITMELRTSYVRIMPDQGGGPYLQREYPPEVPSCVAQVYPPELIARYLNSARSDSDHHNGMLQAQTCAIKFLSRFGDKYIYGYRDVLGVIYKEGKASRRRRAPDFGFADSVFGHILDMATGGLVGLVQDSANGIKHALEGSVRAKAVKLPPQQIMTELVLLICEAEAANLARQETQCPNSRVANYGDFVERVRQRYVNFVNSH